MWWCIFVQGDGTDTGVPARPLIPTNTHSIYIHCVDRSPTVCNSVSHNNMRHRADKIKGGILLFDCWESLQKNKLNCYLTRTRCHAFTAEFLIYYRPGCCPALVLLATEHCSRALWREMLRSRSVCLISSLACTLLAQYGFKPQTFWPQAHFSNCFGL